MTLKNFTIVVKPKYTTVQVNKEKIYLVKELKVLTRTVYFTTKTQLFVVSVVGSIFTTKNTYDFNGFLENGENL